MADDRLRATLSIPPESDINIYDSRSGARVINHGVRWCLGEDEEEKKQNCQPARGHKRIYNNQDPSWSVADGSAATAS